MAKRLYEAFECELTGKVFKTEQEANACSVDTIKLRLLPCRTPADIENDLAEPESDLWKAIDWCSKHKFGLTMPKSSPTALVLTEDPVTSDEEAL